MSPAKARKAIEDWVSKRAHEITLKAQQDMDEIASCAKINLAAEIDGLKTQADVMDVLVPLNLIDIITKGGFVKGDVFTVPYAVGNLVVTVDHERVLHSDNHPIRLTKGKYKVVLIVEKLEEEAKSE